MTLTRLWLRIELRRSASSLVLVAVLVGLSAGLVLAAVAGARRADSSQARLAAVTRPADLLVAPAFAAFDTAGVRALPQVAASDTATEYGIAFDGIPVASGRAGAPVHAVVPYGDQLLHTLETPVVLSGRLPSPARADEAAVTSGFAASYHRRVGDTLHPTLAIGIQGDASLLPAAVRIVGVIRSPLFSDDATTEGRIVLTPALGAILQKINPDPFSAPVVRLTRGTADVPAFTAAMQRLPGGASASVLDTAEDTRRRQHVLDFENRFLLSTAGCLLLAALVLIGQAVARIAAGTVTRLQPLRGVGITRRQLAALAAAPPVLAGVVGTLLATALSLAVSPLFPLGSAAAYEPDPGFRLDPLVVVAGVLLTPLLIGGPAAAGAWIAARRADDDRSAVRRSPVVERMAQLGVPVPVLIGTRFAFERSTGARAVPARSAQIGSIVGVFGLVAALTFAAAVGEATRNPARFGQSFQLSVPLALPFSPDQATAAARTNRAVMAAITADPDVVAVNDGADAGGVLVAASGATTGTDLVLNRYQPVKGHPGVVLLGGRMPVAADEVVLAPESAETAGVTTGEKVRLRGGGGERELTVTGIGLVPESWRGSYAEGAWLSGTGYLALAGDDQNELEVYVTVRGGAAPAAVAHRLDAAMAAAAGFDLSNPPPQRVYQVEIEHEPARVGEVRRVRSYPVVLGGFLALLALAAVGHTLASAARRRRGELAVLRATGMTPRQTWAVIGVQAAVLGLIGLAFGIPLGLGLGRTLWRAVSAYTPLQYVAPGPWLLLAGCIPAVLVLALALAVRPGHQVSRARLAVVLRAE